ncbi:MAG: hypothetical protein HPZ91_11315 [Lentisphaeria bacterium]|nr:hypothetical protein [Lentisphaeria bacterium]
MSRDIGNYITCGVLAVLFTLFLPFVLLLIVVLAVVQLLTGRKVIRMNRWYQRQAEPPPPEEDPEREVRASEAIIDAEVVDLPDEPPPGIENNGRR